MEDLLIRKFTRFNFLHGIHPSVFLIALIAYIRKVADMTYSELPVLISWTIAVDNSAEYIIYQGGCLVCLRRGLGDWAPIPCALGPELKLDLLGGFPDLKYRPWSTVLT